MAIPSNPTNGNYGWPETDSGTEMNGQGPLWTLCVSPRAQTCSFSGIERTG